MEVRGSGSRLARAAHLLGATAMACVMAATSLPPSPAGAQALSGVNRTIPAGEQMLLEADTLVYDNDAETVTAQGGVQIDYGGNRLVANRVVYDRKTGRLMALGSVEVIDEDGNKIYADEIDVTDDFRDGFVNTLQLETVNKTYFAAESAERREGRVTTFNNGVYTACEPCRDKPGKAPIWRIKSQRIVWDGQEKTITFRNARFELFGLPIAYLPYFVTADPTVKRKSGFLFPGIHYKTELGVGVSIPYYLALSPTYDATFTGTYYTNQGFLGQAEWRQRFDNGQYNVHIAGISQRNPKAFDSIYNDSRYTSRFMIASRGDFKINPRWSFGWDVLAQTDKNFSRTYDISPYDDYVETSQIYLTGLNDRNYFDLRGYHFHIQEDAARFTRTGVPIASARDHLQPWVLPSFDYTYTPDVPVLGGELSFDLNSQSIYRDAEDFSANAARPLVRGIDGSTGRLTAEAEWKRQVVVPGGLVLTPSLHGRMDGIYVDADGMSLGNLNGLQYSHNGMAYSGITSDLRSSYFRPMATAGLEARWPILFSGPGSSHVIEPMGQIFVRPDEPYGSTLDIPNEDAQSLVFDAASLFERDKFSGYDRVEGGTRANLGIRYSGSFNNGWSATGIFGQSYHLAGENPYASPDLVNVGAYSGLETEVSDYVGLVGLSSPSGISLAAAGRFDEKTFETRRTEVRAGFSTTPLSVTASYAFIESQPLYGFTRDRREVTLSASTRFAQYWSAFGSGTYDFQSDQMVRNSFGFAYDDECFTYAMTYSQITTVPNSGPSRTTESIGVRLSFRTLGDFGSDTRSLDQQ